MNVPTLHAKAVILESEIDQERLGWIGSANFTIASECRCLELGVMVAGKDAAEARILTSLKCLLDGWACNHAKPNPKR